LESGASGRLQRRHISGTIPNLLIQQLLILISIKKEKNMLNIIFGALTIGLLWFLVNFVNSRSLKIAWWQWVLTILGLVYLVFVLASVSTLIVEGAPQAALVIGGIFGFIAVIWGVLVGRFVFLRKN
jgi:hypothetical protein